MTTRFTFAERPFGLVDRFGRDDETRGNPWHLLAGRAAAAVAPSSCDTVGLRTGGNDRVHLLPAMLLRDGRYWFEYDDGGPVVCSWRSPTEVSAAVRRRAPPGG